jgi:membrane protease YdiL (CAAX protease family)
MPTESPSPSVRHFAHYYWTESRRPWVSLAFILPMLIVYELGVWLFNEQTGVDVWMKSLLNAMGFSQHLLPFIAVGILLGWHHLNHEKWRFSPSILSIMVVECLVLAILLQFLSLAFGSHPGEVQNLKKILRQSVVFLGTGVYEELLFRLMLFSALRWVLRRFWPSGRKSTLLAMLVSSLIFAVAHFVGPGGQGFSWSLTLFLFLAGVYFAVVFVYRGFGIAAGTHALYDILVSLFTG